MATVLNTRKMDTPPIPSDRLLNSYLKSIYYDPAHPAGYAGGEKVYQAIKAERKYKVTRKRLMAWLRLQNAYTTFKPVRRRFKRPRLIVSDRDQQWDCDTLNMTYFKDYNNGYAYILICIDIFTRYLITRPLQSLRGAHIKEVFNDIFSLNEKPQTIRTDRGSEFMNELMGAYFNNKKIKHFYTNNEVKASHAERVIKTLRTRIGRFLKGKILLTG